jgi:hypothetical protein
MSNVKKETLKNPSRDDVHEQREADQPREGVVETSPPAEPRPPSSEQRGQPEKK